jgi:hypothetical protein
MTETTQPPQPPQPVRPPQALQPPQPAQPPQATQPPRLPQAPQPPQPPRPLTVLGSPALVEGEDAGLYNDLLARVSGHLKPRDIFEEIWTREIVDLVWEAERWRRYLASFLNTAVAKRLESILEERCAARPAAGGGFRGHVMRAMNAQGDAHKLAQEWASGDPQAMERVEQELAKVGMTINSVRAQAIGREIETVERFNRLIASAEGRRNGLLREIDRRRGQFAQQLRQQVQKIEQSAAGPGTQRIKHGEPIKAPAPQPERRAA